MSFLNELKQRIVDQGAIAGASVFLSTRSNVPTGDGPYVVLIETGGSGSDYIHNQDDPNIDYPAAQIRIHAKTWESARATAKAVWDALVNVRNQQLSGTFYLNIRPLQQIWDPGRDDTGRAQAIFNVLAMKRPS